MKTGLKKLSVSFMLLSIIGQIFAEEPIIQPTEQNPTLTSTQDVNTASSSTNIISSTTNTEVTVSSSEPINEEPQPIPEKKSKKRDWLDLVFGFGVVISPEYGDSIDDMYNTGGYINMDDYSGLVDLYAGIEIRPINRFGILVGIDTLFGANVEAAGGVLDEDYVNIIFVPSIYGQLYLTKSRWLYINAGVNFPFADSQSEYFDLEGDGAGFGANVGVELAHFLRIEGGYTYIPVTVKASSKNGVNSDFEGSYNYGGAQLRILFAF
jgi:hypothetical protein